MTRPEVAAFIRHERQVWGGVVKRLGFSPQ
jgi:hypothetical protein